MTTTQTTSVPVRLDFETQAPTFSRALSRLDHAATKELDAVEFDARLRELVRIRASQINGCAYCIDMHTKDARPSGRPSSASTPCPPGARRRTSPCASEPRWPSPSR